MRAYLRKEALGFGEGLRPVIFLDRDGVINKRMPMHCHVLCEDDLEILPDVYEAVSIINEKGYISIVVTNQRCIALGTLDEAGFYGINDRMISDLSSCGAFVDGVYYCPHDGSDGCSCRKPGTGLFEEAESDLEALGITIDRQHSWMVGDEDTDIEAGGRYGVNTVKIGEKVPDLLAAVRMITGKQ